MFADLFNEGQFHCGVNVLEAVKGFSSFDSFFHSPQTGFDLLQLLCRQHGGFSQRPGIGLRRFDFGRVQKTVFFDGGVERLEQRVFLSGSKSLFPDFHWPFFMKSVTFLPCFVMMALCALRRMA